MAVTSAGLLLYRRRGGMLELLLVHPGGPFWKNKDPGAWSIPKGEYTGDEAPLAAARREFAEELGFAPEGEFIYLGEIRQKGGKTVMAWAVEGDCDPSTIVSNTFSMEYPPKSGKFREFPEIDRAAWFDPESAKEKINPAQAPLIDRLIDNIRENAGPD